MKNAFYFTSKALFVLKIFKFLSWLFGRVEKWLNQKDKVRFKIYDNTTWLTSNCNKQILPNISKSKGNQTVKFGELKQYNMRNIFLEKSYSKYGEETILRLVFKKVKIEHISGSIFESFIQFVFIVCQVEGFRNILKLSCRAIAFTSYKAFFKETKRGLEILFLSHFLYELWRKLFLLLHCINWPNFIVWLPLLPEILDNMCNDVVYEILKLILPF